MKMPEKITVRKFLQKRKDTKFTGKLFKKHDMPETGELIKGKGRRKRFWGGSLKLDKMYKIPKELDYMKGRRYRRGLLRERVRDEVDQKILTEYIWHTQKEALGESYEVGWKNDMLNALSENRWDFKAAIESLKGSKKYGEEDLASIANMSRREFYFPSIGEKVPAGTMRRAVQHWMEIHGVKPAGKPTRRVRVTTPATGVKEREVEFIEVVPPGAKKGAKKAAKKAVKKMDLEKLKTWTGMNKIKRYKEIHKAKKILRAYIREDLGKGKITGKHITKLEKKLKKDHPNIARKVSIGALVKKERDALKKKELASATKKLKGYVLERGGKVRVETLRILNSEYQMLSIKELKAAAKKFEDNYALKAKKKGLKEFKKGLKAERKTVWKDAKLAQKKALAEGMDKVERERIKAKAERMKGKLDRKVKRQEFLDDTAAFLNKGVEKSEDAFMSGSREAAGKTKETFGMLKEFIKENKERKAREKKLKLGLKKKKAKVAEKERKLKIETKKLKLKEKEEEIKRFRELRSGK